MRAIVLDIEGTTTPIAFVRDTLFPYARRELGPFLAAIDEEEIRSVAADFAREHQREERTGDLPEWSDASPDADRESIARYVAWLMDRDRKSTALKALQGRIWARGYESGQLIAPVYDDVPVALRRWRTAGVGVGIYSSGSVLAQQLLFRHTCAGDLTAFLHWHFDTTVGAKTETDSYRRIAAVIDLPSTDILFISDVVRELDAASGAGFQTILCQRPGEPEAGDPHRHRSIASFADVTA